MSEEILPEMLDPLLDYLSSILPAPLYALATSLLANLYSLALSLVHVGHLLLKTPPASWDAETILPPVITLLMAYLALLSFYRTTGWMLRTTFSFVKWGVFLAALGVAAGYVLANSNLDGQGSGSGVGQLGAGLLSSLGGLGGLLVSLLGGADQNASTRPRTRSRTRTRTQTAPRPKPWENWDRHYQWQYSEDGAHRDTAADVQEAIRRVVHNAGSAIRESGWWDAAKSAVDDFSKGLKGDGAARDRQEHAQEAQGRTGTR